MRLRKIFLYATLLLLTILSLRPDSWAQENPELTKTLARIDAISAKFSSFEAKFTQRYYVALLKKYDTSETGEFYYALDKDRSVQMRFETLTPGITIVTVKGDSGTKYQPATKQAQILNLGKNRNLVEYMGTGLGQTSARLREQFEITYDGTEDAGGEPCSVLTLVPKDKDVAASFKAITLWVKKSTGTPAQYKFLEPTNNYMLITFSDDKLNGKIPADKFEQRLPRETEILRIN